MLLISEVWNVQSDIRQFKAPKGKQYNITTIAFSNFGSVANFLIIFDTFLEEPPVDLGFNRQYLALFDLGLDGSSGQISDVNHNTKYISCGPRTTAANINASLQIFGDLITISKIFFIN